MTAPSKTRRTQTRDAKTGGGRRAPPDGPSDMCFGVWGARTRQLVFCLPPGVTVEQPDRLHDHPERREVHAARRDRLAQRHGLDVCGMKRAPRAVSAPRGLSPRRNCPRANSSRPRCAAHCAHHTVVVQRAGRLMDSKGVSGGGRRTGPLRLVVVAWHVQRVPGLQLGTPACMGIAMGAGGLGCSPGQRTEGRLRLGVDLGRGLRWRRAAAAAAAVEAASSIQSNSACFLVGQRRRRRRRQRRQQRRRQSSSSSGGGGDGSSSGGGGSWVEDLERCAPSLLW